MSFKKLFLFFTLLISLTGGAQTRHEQTAWAAWFNSTKINNRWGIHFDLQARTHDNWKGVRNILLRPGVTYFLRSNQTATAGYLFTPTFPAPGVTGGRTLTEHRIWEQYIVGHSLFNGNVNHRFRLEQRFIGRVNEHIFAQRFRYFVRDVQPLIKTAGNFTKGPFVALQNEVFFNIQNKSKLNNAVFDQNRAYLALGYRVFPNFDIEAGYLNLISKGITQNTVNNAMQFVVYTRF